MIAASRSPALSSNSARCDRSVRLGAPVASLRAKARASSSRPASISIVTLLLASPERVGVECLGSLQGRQGLVEEPGRRGDLCEINEIGTREIVACSHSLQGGRRTVLPAKMLQGPGVGD